MPPDSGRSADPSSLRSSIGRAVGPVEPWPRTGAAQYGDVVPQDEQLGTLDADDRLSRTSQPQTRMKIR
jgi:hypothetical protein